MATQYRVRKFHLSDGRIVFTPQVRILFFWRNVMRYVDRANPDIKHLEPVDFPREALAQHWITLKLAKSTKDQPQKITRKAIA